MFTLSFNSILNILYQAMITQALAWGRLTTIKLVVSLLMFLGLLALPPWEEQPNDLINQRKGFLPWVNDFVSQLAANIEIRIQPRHRKQPRLWRRSQKKWSNKWTRLMACSVIAMSADHQERYTEEGGPFDTDSSLIGIDNRCSACISHKREDFLGSLVECHRSVKGFGGARHFKVWQGTIRWSWDDDEGCKHTFVIPKSYYIPEGKVRLLSPQHFAQSQSGKDLFPP